MKNYKTQDLIDLFDQVVVYTSSKEKPMIILYHGEYSKETIDAFLENKGNKDVFFVSKLIKKQPKQDKDT